MLAAYIAIINCVHPYTSLIGRSSGHRYFPHVLEPKNPLIQYHVFPKLFGMQHASAHIGEQYVGTRLQDTDWMMTGELVVVQKKNRPPQGTPGKQFGKDLPAFQACKTCHPLYMILYDIRMHA